MKYLLIFFITVFPALGFSLEVSVTIKPLHVLLSAVSKGVFVPNLIINSDSPHSYHLTPNAKRLMQNSDIVFYLSPEFEHFTNKNQPENWIELLPLMPNIINVTEHQQDMHVWLDPDNAIAIINIMVESLSRYDPENAAIYKQNAEQLIEKIHQAVKHIHKIFSITNNVNYVVVHDAYSYFTKYFNIPSGNILLKNNQEHVTPKALHDLKNLINKDLACIIADPYHKSVISKKIYQQSRLIIIDPVGQNEEQYTDLLYSVAIAFQKCFTR